MPHCRWSGGYWARSHPPPRLGRERPRPDTSSKTLFVGPTSRKGRRYKREINSSARKSAGENTNLEISLFDPHSIEGPVHKKHRNRDKHSRDSRGEHGSMV